jgi:hypothetical protein
MKLKYIIIACQILLFIVLIKIFIVCTNYNGNFHFSTNVVNFHINELIATENETNIFIVRLFHNKITASLFDIISRYIQFFDINYLINILGIAGLFGVLCFYYLLFTKKLKSKIAKALGIMVPLLPFFEIFQILKILFTLKLILFIVTYQVLALIGSYFFIKRADKKTFIIFLLLLIISFVWILVFKNELTSFCTTG